MEAGPAIPILLMIASAAALAMVLLAIAAVFNPKRPGSVQEMPYESGMDPVHDTRRRFNVRFHLMAIAFLVFDVELLFLYPWAVAMRPAVAAESVAAASAGASSPVAAQDVAASGISAAVEAGLASSRDLVFAGAMLFLFILVLGFVYDLRKGVFRWR
jgi:NADH-quinone oxidoreductase subunit A